MHVIPTLERNPWAATARRLLLLPALVAALLIGATTWGAQTAYAADITVDGTTCTLADAITAANTDTATGGCVAGSGADTINLQTDVSLTSILPNITSEITINGNDYTIARDPGAAKFRILSVAAGANFTLNRVTLANGIADGRRGGPGSSGAGGALENFGTTTLNHSVIRDNQAYLYGGGVANLKDAHLTVNNSTFSGNTYLLGSNTTYVTGAGILNTGGTVTVNNSTFSNNTGGAALQTYRDSTHPGKSVMTVTNTTITANDTGGGILVSGEADVTVDSVTIIGTPASRRPRPKHISIASSNFTPGTARLTIRNSILLDPSGGTTALCSVYAADGQVASLVSDGHNLASDASCGFTATGDQQNVSAANLKIGPLADNGGDTQTYALLPGSPAIDAGDTTLTADQRGIVRPRGTADDIGAFETQACPSSPWDVGNAVDLNFAILCYNAVTAAGTYTINITGDIDLAASPNTIDNARSGVSLVINGNGHTVDGQNIAGMRPFEIGANTTVAIEKLTITGGNVFAAGGAGGGILNYGDLTLSSVTVFSNTAQWGGGIRNDGGSLNIRNSTIRNNYAPGPQGEGGGISNGNSGTMVLQNSTVSENSAGFFGGGIATQGASNTLDSVTVAANLLPASGTLYGSGIHIGLWGSMTMTNTLVAKNTGGDADLTLLFGTFVDGGHNLVESTSGRNTVVNGVNGNIVGQSAKIGPLTDNGGDTWTHALLSDSPAIDAGSTTLTTDQRGEPRPQGVPADIGAFEVVQPGTIIIEKRTAPAGGVDFSFVITDTQGVASTFALSDTQRYTVTNLVAGTYLVSEDIVVGGRLSAIQCDDAQLATPSTGDLATRTASINVSPGETVTCTFTNTADDVIIIEKSTYPVDGTGFSFTSDIPVAGAANFSLDHGDFEFFTVTTGTYVITETNPGPNWELGDINCTVLPADQNDDTSTSVSTNLSAGSVTLDMSVAGRAAYCVFTNLGLGSITINKDALPAENIDFNFVIANTQGVTDAFTLNSAGVISESFEFLSGGVYTITEAAVNGWSLSDIGCTSTSGNSSFAYDVANGQAVIDLDEGDDLSCTFTNKKHGTLTIQKEAFPNNDGTEFAIGQSVDGSGAFTLTHGTSKTFSDIPSAQYVFTETLPSGWQMSLVSCQAVGGSPVLPNIDYPAAQFFVELPPGADVTCTVSNKLYASLTIKKETVGGDGTFNFTSGFFPQNSFDLTTVGGTVERTFTDLPSLITYNIRETPQPGWALTSATCDNGNTPDAVFLNPGDDVTCTYRNEKTGSITLLKNANPIDGTVFNLEYGAANTTTPFTLTHAMSTTYSNMVSGLYTFTEKIPLPWYLDNVTCATAGGNTVTPTINNSFLTNRFALQLPAAEDVTCTVFNKQYATLTLRLESVGGDETFHFTSPNPGVPFANVDLGTVGGVFEQVFNALPSDATYNIVQTVRPGWTLTNPTCDNGDSPAAVTLAPGDDVTCTFRNEKQGSLTVVKNAIGGAATFGFTSQALGDFSLTTAGGAAQRTFANLAAGVYDLSENALAGWTQISATCDNGSTLPTVNVGAGEDVTCTFENRKQTTIVIIKKAVGGDDTFVFNSPQLGNFSLKTTKGVQSANFDNLTPGATYSISETVPVGWTQATADPICSNNQPASAITLNAGETVTCEFVNYKNDTLIVQQVAIGGDDTFAFSSPQLGDFSLSTTGSTASQSFTQLAPGPYQITQTPRVGWAQVSFVCSNGDGPENVTLAPGANVTCVFTNTKLSSITLVQNSVGGDGTFNFTSTMPNQANFALTTVAGSDQQTFTNLRAGTYAITETIPAGWDQTAVSCSDGSPVSAIDLTLGEDVTCVFENTKRGSLTIVKNAVGGDAAFSFSSQTLGSFVLTTTNGAASQSFADLVPGVYSVAETMPADWLTASVAVCDNGYHPDKVSVGPGEDVTCTFSNRKTASIVVVKRAVGGEGVFTFNSNPFGVFTMTTTSGNDQYVFSGLAPGGYAITEDAQTGWTPAEADPVCSNGDRAGGILLGAGETVTCVFENRKNDSVTVQKRAIGGDGSFDFTSDLPGGSTFNLTTVTGTADIDFSNIPAGSYAISETVPAGWTQTAAACDNGDPAGGVSLAAGESTICTFENTKLGKIVVQKRAIGGDGDFVFGGDFGTFDLKTAGTAVKRDFFDVAPGTYTITETVQPGWDQTLARCTDGSDPSSLVLSAGEEVTCFFVNTKRGSLTVVKETTGGDGTFSFTSAAPGNFSLTTVNGTAQRSFTNLRPGVYDLSETVPAGWTRESATCSDGSNPAAVSVDPGENVTCTFRNTKRAGLTVVKNTVGGDAAFGFTSPQLGNVSLSTVNGTAQRSFANLTPGVYAITETVPAGWQLTGVSCSDGSSVGSINLTPGINVTCTFTDTATGSLTVVKEAVGGDETFNFTSSALGNFAIATSSGAGQTVFGDLLPGTYDLAETVPAGWSLDTATCSDGSNPASVDLSAGEDVTCTFRNVKLDTIVVIKRTQGGEGTFNFNSPQLGGFDLATSKGRSSRSFSGLQPGSYSITETATAGWNAASADPVCSNGQPASAITLNAGETVICEFVNLRQDTIIVEKKSIGGDGTFAFSGDLGSFSLSTSQGSVSQSFSGLAAGTYVINETVPAGWVQTSATCSNGASPAAVTLGAGETVTCTFTNTKLGSLTVVKQAVGGDAAFDFNGGQLGNFSLTTVGGAAQRRFANLAAGTYNVAETLPAGWTQSGASCSDGSNPASVDLAAGEDVICTFRNVKQSSLTVVKNAVGGDAAFSFTSAALGNFSLTTANGTAQQRFSGLAAGTYAIAETVPAGWALTAASCSDGSDPANISLAAGEDVTCTFENTKLDTIVVVQKVAGGDAAFDFSSPQLGGFTLTTVNGTAQRSFSNLSAGRYDISVLAPAGWTPALGAPTCSNGDPADAINLAAGETVVCVFEAVQQDTIIVEKVTVGGDGAFSFTSAQLGNFALTTSNGAASRSFSGLTPGTFAISETVPAGWALTSASCDNGDDPGSITLAAGETVTCRFVNTKQASLTIVKQTVSGDGVFNFSSSKLGNFALTTTSGAAQRTFDNLTPGAYSVTEMANQAWQLVGASCDNGDSPASLTLGAGDNVTCVFENRQRTLVIYLPQIFNQMPQVATGRRLYLPQISHTLQQVVYTSNFSAGVGSGWSTGTTTTTSPSGVTFLGEFGASVARSQDSARANGTSLSLANLPAHTRVTVSLDLYVIRSWDGNQEDLPADPALSDALEATAIDGTIGPDRWLLKQGDRTILDASFSNISSFSQSYPVAFGAANNPAQTGRTAVNSLGYTYQGSPMDATYRIVQSFAHNADSLTLSFEALGLQIPEDESWGIDNVTVTVE